MKKALNVVVGRIDDEVVQIQNVVSICVDELRGFVMVTADGREHHTPFSNVVSITLTDRHPVDYYKPLAA